MTLYNREILHQGTSGLNFIQSKIANKPNAQKYVTLPDGFEISLIRVSSAMHMKTMQELDLRREYRATINNRTENSK